MQLRNWLKEVYDPELGVNIVDLGLVYEVRQEPDRIYVQMTLTTPGCPLHDTIIDSVKWMLAERSGQSNIEVDMVWEPQWKPSMMSEDAKDILGYF
ncbi:metal-sulfur cluster assembly factor [Paenibacillus sp. PR3]|uniref:Metal-sulfur cluster assembly factor n=2 Tax=Paenibacillus terricola TaxID=2763503 RepID=A0ABR8MWN1_9BACL|nr:metal-sulfur cluster assembly factor [Paenibacillus terricola]